MKHTPTFKHALRHGLHWLTILSWVAGLVLTVSPVPVAYALTINVNTTSDIVDGDGCSGTCSLREAVLIANGAPGADTINIPAGTYNLTRTGGGSPADLGDLDITDQVTLSGAGSATTTINASTLVTTTDRAFEIIAANATFSGLTITGGSPSGNGGGILLDTNSAITLTNSVVASNTGPQGGGIYNNGGAVILDNSVVRNNSSTGSGGGLYNDVGSALTLSNNSQVLTNTATNDGGGIFNASTSTLNITLSTLSGNTTSASGSGAGLQNAGTATLTNATISTNTAGNNGGGVNNAGGTLSANGGTIQNNTAGGSNGGGGFRNTSSGVATLTNVTLSSNVITGTNAGGAGVLNSSGQVTLSGSTIASNTATGTGTDGGGVALVAGATVTLTTSTVNNNSAVDNGGGLYNAGGSLILSGSSVLTNTAAVGGGVVNDGGSSALNITGGTIAGNSASGSTGGGGVRNNNGGTVTITSATISNNSASSGRGGGILNSIGTVNLTGVTVGPSNTAGAFGGGISNSSVTTTLTINNSTITGNTATGGSSGGAGIDNDGGVVTLTNSTVSSNALSGTGGGGGLRNETGTVSIIASTFSTNTTTVTSPSSADGGGVLNTLGGTLNIISSTLNNNSAGLGSGSGDGGGLANISSTVAITASVFYSNQTDGGNGGGIESDNASSLYLDNVTLSANQATSGSGGGLRNNTGSTAILANVTIKDNTMTGGSGAGLRNSASATLTIRNSLLANNGATQNCSNAGTMTSQGYNLKSDTTCNTVFIVTGDITNATPLLGTLTDNGGPTRSHALLVGSPAIDMGNPAGCLDTAGAVFATDQRGRARPFGSRCDIGAFEFESTDLSISKTIDQSPAVPGAQVQYTITVTNDISSTITVPNALVTDTFSSQLTNTVWSCTPNDGGANCDSASGAGNISTTVDLAPGSSATFIVNADVVANLTGGTLTNTAYITPSAGTADTNGANNSATIAVPIEPHVDLVLTKDDGQTTAIPGAGIVYTITINNNGPSNASNAPVTDTPPAALTGVTWSCSTSIGSNCDTASGSGNISHTVDVAVGGTVTFVLTGTIASDATGTLTNTASITAPVGAVEDVPGDNSADDVNTLTPTVDLGINKTDGQFTTTAGSLITYTIVVSNTGPSDATNAVVTDTFPASVTGVSWTCSASSGSACSASGSGNISETVTLLPGGTLTFTAGGSIVVSSTGSIVNTAYASPAAGATDSDTNNNQGTDSTSLDTTVDLGLTKDDGQTSDVPGTTITYTIVISNTGTAFATNATVTDTLPASLTNASWSCVAGTNSNCDAANGTGNINTTVDVAAGSAVTFTLVATIDPSATGTLTNTASVIANVIDVEPNTSNNTGADGTTLAPQADLGIIKTDGLSNIVPGSAITYTITVNNVGPSTATGLTVTDTFPTVIEGITWLCSATGLGAACPASGSGNINTSAVDLPPGTTVIFQATGTLTSTAALGVLTNTAYVSAPGGVTDTNLSNNSEADNTTIVDSLILQLFLPLIRR